MRGALRAALAACLLMMMPGLLPAQASARRGVWLGLGLGHGSAQLTCAICAGGRDGGLSGFVRGGVALSPRLLIGAEVLGWRRHEGGGDYTLTSAQGLLVLYPWRTRALHFSTGAGLARYTAQDTDNEISTQAFAMQVGAGWDVPVRRGISVTPFVNFVATTGADVKVNSTASSLSANSSLIQFGLGVTLH